MAERLSGTVLDDLGPLGWMDQAACLDADPTVFFAPDGKSEDGDFDTEPALRHCRRCRVDEECLRYALSRPQDENYGIWGGATPEERNQLRGRGHRGRRR